MVKKEQCSNCKWHKQDVTTLEWMCLCDGADEYGDYTPHNHHCWGWEEKRKTKDA